MFRARILCNHLARALLRCAIGIHVLAGPAVAQRAQNAAATAISGTVRMYGCMPQPSQLVLNAVPFTAAGERTLDPRAVQIPARFTATSNPRLLSFVIQGLIPNTPYRLAVAYPDEDCGRIFWRGPEDGFAFSGGPLVAIDGYAARTTIEVLSLDTDEWVGFAELKLTEASLGSRQFRWRSTLPGVVRGELQVSVEPFPRDVTLGPCVEPEQGIVHRRSVSASDGEWVDAGVVDLPLILGRAANAGQRTLLMLGAPIYVRVVPELATGAACNPDTDGAAGWTMLGVHPGGPILPPPPVPPTPAHLQASGFHIYIPPYTGGPRQGQPSYGQFSYKIIKPHQMPSLQDCDIGYKPDIQGCILVWEKEFDYGQFVTPGREVWTVDDFVPPKNGGGWFDQTFGAFVTAGADAVGLLLQIVHDVFESIKAEARKAVVGLLNTFAPGACEEIQQTPTSCDELVATGITIALAAAGVPPSIPNWDQLKDHGVEYAAAMVATEFQQQTGVPSALTEFALEQLAEKAFDNLSANRPGMGVSADWLIPYFGFDPAALSLDLARLPGTAAAMPAGLMLHALTTPLYQGRLLPLPTVWPSDNKLRIPIVLRPNLSGLGPAYCYSDGGKDLYTCSQSLFSNVDNCWYKPYYTGAPTVAPIGCSGLNLPEIFYRDSWINKRLNTTPCTSVAVHTVLNFFFAHIVPPPDDWAFFLGADLVPRFVSGWTGPLHDAC